MDERGSGSTSSSSKIHHTLVVFQSVEIDCFASVTDLQGYCVVDTACQRSCCSRRWSLSQRELLQGFGLEALMAKRVESFKFGAGPPQVSRECMYFPVTLDASYPLIALSASVLDGLQIPFLASLGLMKKLNIVLDLAKQKAFIGLLGCSVDLRTIQGHLCLKLSEQQQAHD